MTRKLALSAALATFALLLTAGDAPRIASAPDFRCGAIPAGPVNTALAGIFAVDETRAVKLVVDDCPAVTLYAPGYSADNRFISWSMAKTITAILVGELVDEGRLSLDAPVPLAEWRGAGDPHGAITLRQMLHMESGVRHEEDGDPVEDSDTNQVEFVTGSAAMAAGALAEPVEVPPGSRWEYNTLTTIALSELITRTLTDSRDPHERARVYRAFAEERLFRPAGVTSAFPEFDGSGTQVGGSLIHMTLDDWARIGAVLLDGRGANGARIVSPEWLAFMKAPSAHNPQYGGQLWLNNPQTGNEHVSLFPGMGPDGTVAMNGHVGQHVVAASGEAGGEAHRLVLVRLGNTPSSQGAALMQRLGAVVEAAIPRSGTYPRPQ